MLYSPAKLSKLIAVLTILLLILVTSYAYLFDKNFPSALFSSLLSVLLLVFIFYYEQEQINKRVARQHYELLKTFLHELNANLDMILGIPVQFKSILELLRRDIFVSAKLRKVNLLQEKGNEINTDLIGLVSKYSTLASKEGLNFKYLRSFVDDFGQIREKHKSSFDLFELLPAIIFTFNVKRDILHKLLDEFQDSSSKEGELRAQLMKLKHIYDVYYTNIYICLFKTNILSESKTKRIYYNSILCNLMYVDDFIGHSTDYLNGLFKIYPSLKTYSKSENLNHIVSLPV